jgi:hypothetical protein
MVTTTDSAMVFSILPINTVTAPSASLEARYDQTIRFNPNCPNCICAGWSGGKIIWIGEDAWLDELHRLGRQSDGKRS